VLVLIPFLWRNFDILTVLSLPFCHEIQQPAAESDYSFYNVIYLFITILRLTESVALKAITFLLTYFKKFPAFYGTKRFITAFTNAHHLPLS
jgi:hypothetical protein